MEPLGDSLLARLRALNVSQEKTVPDLEMEPQSKETGNPFVLPDFIMNMDYAGLTETLKPVTYDFSDSKYLYEKGIVLKRLSDSEVVSIGRWCIPMITSEFTESGSAAILLLAYNLKTGKPGSWKYVFHEELIENSASDKPYDQFSNEVLRANGVHQSLRGGGELDIEAAFYSYIAASLLRMPTRSGDHYVNSWNHIYGGFSRFYGVNPPVRLPPPSQDAIMPIQGDYVVGSPWNITLFKTLYAGSKDQTASRLKNFLYDRYLEYYNFHVVGILYRLCDIFDCSAKVILLSALRCGRRFPLSRGAIRCFEKIMEMAASDDEEHKRNMWRYGMMFEEGDDTFMWHLQTRNCLKLVYTFGSALKEVAPAENSGILNIAQLQRLTSEQQLECAKAGKKLVKSFRESVSDSTTDTEESDADC